jgi:hypothetical protein
MLPPALRTAGPCLRLEDDKGAGKVRGFQRAGNRLDSRPPSIQSQSSD